MSIWDGDTDQPEEEREGVWTQDPDPWRGDE